jgi:hypothetical protein
LALRPAGWANRQKGCHISIVQHTYNGLTPKPSSHCLVMENILLFWTIAVLEESSLHQLNTELLRDYLYSNITYQGSDKSMVKVSLIIFKK